MAAVAVTAARYHAQSLITHFTYLPENHRALRLAIAGYRYGRRVHSVHVGKVIAG